MVSLNPKRCDRCGGFFDPLSRQATQNAMGPWYIRDLANPTKPGCSFETLREMIRRGKVTRETILRGPTTRQFWNFASRTPSVANLLGLCHNCHVEVSPEDYACRSCGAVFSPETDRQHLGLAPVHLLPGQASAEMIAASSLSPTPPPRPQPEAGGNGPAPGVIGKRVIGLALFVGVAGLVAAIAIFGSGAFRGAARATPKPAAPAAEAPGMTTPAADATVVPSPAPESAPEPAVVAAAEQERKPEAPAEPAAPSLADRMVALLAQEPPDWAGAEVLAKEAGGDAGAWQDLVRRRAERARLSRLP